MINYRDVCVCTYTHPQHLNYIHVVCNAHNNKQTSAWRNDVAEYLSNYGTYIIF